MDEELSEKIDKLIAMYHLVHATEIGEARTKAEADPVVKGILESSQTWLSSGDLKSKVASLASTSEKTVQRRISELVSSGVLSTRREGTNLMYKSSGLLG